jgi:hypothetical protein
MAAHTHRISLPLFLSLKPTNPSLSLSPQNHVSLISSPRKPIALLPRFFVSINHLNISPFFLTPSFFLFNVLNFSVFHGFCNTKHGNWLDLRVKDSFGREKDGFVAFEREEEREERFRVGAAMVYGEKRRRNKVKDLWVCEDLRRGNNGFGERERDGFVGLRERKRGREIWGCDCGQPWESGDGEEIF